MPLAIGIDLGGTDIKAGVVSDTGEIVYRTKISTKGHEGGPAVITRMESLIGTILTESEVSTRRGEVVGVGVGSPGLIDQKQGTITCPVNIPEWQDAAPIKSRFEATHGLRTEVDNDANACALGEALFGAGQGKSVVVALTLGTGVGGGVVVHGRVYHGAHGYAAELGHVNVIPDGPPCGCGNFGDIESLASANAIAKAAMERILQSKDYGSLLEKWHSEGIKITSKLVHEAALQNDTLALRVLERAGRYFGIGLSSILVSFDPEIIVIGGGASAMGDLFFDHVRREIEQRVYFTRYVQVPIVRATLGEDAGFIGAAGLVFQN